MTVPDLLAGHSPDPDEPVLVFSVACTGLASPVSSSEDREPNSFVAASYVNPPQTLWTEHARTEVVEGSREPAYLSSVAFFRDSTTETDGDGVVIDGQTRVKLVVYHVEDRKKATPIMLGSALFRLEELLRDESRRLQLELRSDVAAHMGNISVTAWPTTEQKKRDRGETPGAARLLGDITGGAAPAPVEESAAGEFAMGAGTTTTTGAYAPSLSEDAQLRRSLFGHTLYRAYRLPVEARAGSSASSLRVLEQMSESVMSFHVPRQYVELLLKEDAARLRELDELEGELLSPRWDDLRRQTVSRYREMVPAYQEAMSHLDGYIGPSFKASSLKADGKWEFVPTNLHVQRMRVREEGEGEEEGGGPGCEHTYHVITFGAPVAHCRGFENGGLRNLVRQEDAEKHDAHYSAQDVVRAREVAGRIDELRSQVGDLAERLSREAKERSADDVQRTLVALADKTRQLATLCDCKLLALATRALDEARAGNVDDDSERIDLRGDRDAPSVEQSGHSHSRASSRGDRREDEWEKARSNMMESLERVVRRADELLRKDSSLRDATTTWTDRQEDGGTTTAAEEEEEDYPGEWSEALRPLLTTLTQAAAAASDKARKSAAFLWMEETVATTADPSLRYRRDVVFCQALAALVCGFVVELQSRLGDAGFLRQLGAVGLLAQFECLLSNYGDEPAMLEDMSVGVGDLRHITFEVVRAAAYSDGVLPLLLPTLSGGRDGVNVRVPLPAAAFDALPRELRREDAEEEGTKLIHVCPVLFSVGVNRRDPAERLDTSLQDAVNAESLSRLNAHYERFKEEFPPEDSSRSQKTTSLPELLRRLDEDVGARDKPKNVDLLRHAAEACRRLSGVRFTSCRSAKDRTAMSVTLEQCRVVRSEHGMAESVFTRALDCMRSEGCRRELPLKNCGRRLYAFDPTRVQFLPELYRPPDGTFGKGEM